MNKRTPTLVIVSGPPASGKSTLAAKLSIDLSIPVFSKDDIKEVMWDSLGYDEAERSKIAKAACKIMYQHAKDILLSKRSCIIESNFDIPKDAPILQHIGLETLCQLIEIHCIASPEVLEDRLNTRAGSEGGRHPGHQDAQHPNYYERFYIKSKDPLGIAHSVFELDPVDPDFLYPELISQLCNLMNFYKKVKIVVFVPLANADEVRKAMGDAGAGKIGNYTHCSFSSIGTGRFLPMGGANPAIGQVGSSEAVEEERIEMICDYDHLSDVVKAMKAVHPYEEVAYDVFEIIQTD